MHQSTLMDGKYAEQVADRPRWGEEAGPVEAARSNPAAFAELYVHYRTPVHRYLRARASNDEDAIDLTQQVFLRAFEGLAGYRQRGLPFSAWLFRIARNVGIDSHRRSRPTVSWEFIPNDLMPKSEEGLEAAVLRREAHGRLRAALAELPSQQRELLVLRFGSELKMREIAQVVGRSEASVKKQISRAVRSLEERV